MDDKNYSMKNRSKADLVFLNEEYNVNKQRMPAYMACRVKEVPFDIFLWRKKRGWGPSGLFRRNRWVEWKGKSYALEMLAEMHNIKGNLLADRMARGWTLEQALQPVTVCTEHSWGEAQKLKDVRANQKMLRLLVRHHKDRARHILRYGAHPDDADHGFDEAAARLTAMRMESKARQEVRQHGYLLEVA